MGIAINVAIDIDVCPGAPHTLEANISGMGLTYTWSPKSVLLISVSVFGGIQP